jgi:chaperonin GroES
MSLQPLYDRVLVRRNAAVTETKSGILIPTTASEKSSSATVVAVGQGRYEKGALVPMTVVVDDTVLIGKHSGVEVDVDGEKLVILNETEILAVVKA